MTSENGQENQNLCGKNSGEKFKEFQVSQFSTSTFM